ncbi:M23 family metallopeptidase [Paraliomyxa miuraensis]|uniref:M23 family metallopeptidase n=1 Tax=Paraliomyxa miuraensis TaxID=376150 RepID=UPI002250DF30|nr:M23 family metallopeptidase [Paraliomyxa miuraensis]MCX4240943.1 M23 family metallopeptidase [Paraliomyxa miuraensis]
MHGIGARRVLGIAVAASISVGIGGCGDYEDPGPAYNPELGPASTSDDTAGSGSEVSTSLADTGASDDAESTGSTGLPPLDDTGTTGEPNDCPRVRVMVASGEVLNVRPTPSTAQAPIGTLPNNAIVDVIEEVEGEEIDGITLWFHIATDSLDGYVFGGFAECTFEEPPELLPPDGFWLPLECGMSATISQGNDGGVSHQGNAYYAFDFAIGLNTPLVAIADGVVLHTFAETGPGDPCYAGGGPECFAYGNLVVLLHGDGSTSLYKHLNEVLVADGELVPRGYPVGLSGSTGYSTGRHAHVARQEDCGAPNCQSIPLEFVDAGVPVTGQQVTSQNCP